MQAAHRVAVEPAPPIGLSGTAYEAACEAECIDATPENWDDLHNVIWLSPNIVSGSEPDGEAALERIAGMGVKTLLSVDGKTPDAATAERLGMRYVHVPIKYEGIAPDDVAKIAKTFRELEGPFFVHCFHGKHRGPAGAAIGRLVLDGASRQETLAQMVQCGTSKNYEGLYKTIATAPMPSATDTGSLAFDFPAAHPFGGVRAAMIDMARHWDNVVALGKRGWETDPEHPDMDSLNEAEKLAGLLFAAEADPGSAGRPQNYRTWMGEGRAAANELVESLRAHRAGRTGASDAAEKALSTLKQSCSACHQVYRN